MTGNGDVLNAHSAIASMTSCVCVQRRGERGGRKYVISDIHTKSNLSLKTGRRKCNIAHMAKRKKKGAQSTEAKETIWIDKVKQKPWACRSNEADT